MQLEPENREGLITCYCKPLLYTLKIGIYDHSFEEFGNGDKKKYCGDWATNYVIQNALVLGTSLVVVVINVVIVFIFE